LRRWKSNDGVPRGDRRPEADRPVPSHALSETERAQIIAVANEPRFADTPPARIVPALADDGIYIASESSFHRVLRAQGQMNRRGRAQPPRTSRPPTTHIAIRSAEVWCWDVTFLPAQIQGRWFYLYLILDLYSRKIVGSRPKALPTLTPRGSGRFGLCNGITTGTAIAASATSPRHSVMPGRIALCSRPAMRFIKMRGSATQDAGAGRPETGRRSPSSRSIQSAIRLSRRHLHQSSFPVRSAHLLSGSDLATPRRGAQRRGWEERSHPEPRAAWRGWRAPDLPRSEHRGTLNLSRRSAPMAGQ
jgi:hypothetical protein